MPAKFKRVIPVLGLINGRLVKTRKFGNPTYIGDPINAIKVFNEKEVDEIMVVDIRCSADGKAPDYKHLRQIAGEAFMPMGYGGGIHDFETAKKVFKCGIEKVVLNSVLYKNPEIITKISEHYGSQSVVVSLDYKAGLFGKVRPVFYSGKKSMSISVAEFAKKAEAMGAGEIVLQQADNDGTFQGYDLEMLREVVAATKIPVVPLGGAGSLGDLQRAIDAGAHAAAASAIFVFKNNDRNSILISYQSVN